MISNLIKFMQATPSQAYIPFKSNCASALDSPIAAGKKTLKSFIKNMPTIVHRLQFIVLAIVKGRGIETADLLSMTFFNLQRGDANSMIYNKTPSFPITLAAVLLGYL